MIGFLSLVIVINLVLIFIDFTYAIMVRYSQWKAKISDLAVLKHRFKFRDS